MTQKLISYKTVLEALNLIYQSLKTGPKPLSSELKPLRAECKYNDKMEFMVYFALKELGVLERYAMGQKESYAWKGQDVPDKGMAQLVFDFVFSSDSSKTVQNGIDVTEFHKSLRSAYMPYYKPFVPPADDVMPTKHSNARDIKPETIAKHVKILENLYQAISSANFTWSQFIRDNNVSGRVGQAMSNLNIIRSDYRGNHWIYPELPGENLAKLICEQANTLQRNYIMKREKERNQKEQLNPNKAVLNQARIVKEGSVADRVWTSIKNRNLKVNITFADISDDFTADEQKGQIHTALMNLAKKGVLVNVSRGVYALPGNVVNVEHKTEKPLVELKAVKNDEDRIATLTNRRSELITKRLELLKIDQEIAEIDQELNILLKEKTLLAELDKIQQQKKQYA